MATEKSASRRPIPVDPVYFENPKGAPAIMDLLVGLDGVCEALHMEQISYNDHAQLDRISSMSTAVFILASQLRDRFYGNRKPPSWRVLAETRKAQAEWLANRDRLAGTAEGSA